MIELAGNPVELAPCPRCGSRETEELISLCSFRMGKTQFSIKRGAGHNAFQNLTLQNVHDEFGKPVTVNSERELRSAEKRYGFIHSASWGLENKPPQHDEGAGKLVNNYQTKWNHDPAAYSDEEVAKAAKEVGYVREASETLAAAPNPV